LNFRSSKLSLKDKKERQTDRDGVGRVRERDRAKYVRTRMY